MGAVAVCALQSLTAGPVAVLTIKSWMSIMSPAKVLSSFTSRMVSPKIYVECNGNFITQQGLSLLKNSWLYFPFANYYTVPARSGEQFQRASTNIVATLSETKADLSTRKLYCVVVRRSCLNGPSVSAPTPDLISSQPLLRTPATVPAWGVCLQEQPLHPRALEV